ncbi:uncharacterized protein SPAPADRAFT_62371 [Spathaspora passalidarum NRRL Y-27907]|uniref:Uncharacterized protein n=1 Tax=Spathaspora passalidarum (strain NRRL Y-27907 / 11-Y1) TaxID=619300 RepID=G3ARM4_SPAPN|nr:uncharacterized protein SPAPADRAFT_62371 [Spathaspora passalidarum NRRL Y-27907]EGW31777.1 hypothetical protein SPAPADRAFT_62371 [Spathaspora passalidarum NRRL Y-27907]
MGKSFYEKEQEKIRALIKIPLLELVLQFLPHLQPSQRQRDDTWEVVAIQLGQQRFSEAVHEKKSMEEVEAIPELNGFYIREMYEQLFANFKKEMQFRLAMQTAAVPNSSAGSPMRTLSFNPQDRAEALLFTLYQMQYWDVEMMAKVSQEKLEKSFRRYLEQQELGEKDKLEVPLPVVHQYRKSVELKKNEILKEEISKKDKRLEQLAQENKRLLELNHDLLSQLQGHNNP